MAHLTLDDIRTAAAAIANARGGRRGVPAVTNILDLLPDKLSEEVLDDAMAVARALDDSDWQPIETAPGDETILIYVPPFAPMQGTRSGRFGTWMIGARSIFGRDLAPGMEPTHWMPLPEPPHAP